MAKNETKLVRDDNALLDMVYMNLMAISEKIQTSETTNSKLIDAFDSLLATYLDAEENGF